MDSNIRNFSELERLIRENPKKADAQAFEWQQFLKNNGGSSPELYSLQTSEEFHVWAQAHPEKSINTSIWIGKEIADAYYYLRERDEQQQVETASHTNKNLDAASALTMTPLLAASFLQRPKTMQDDPNYKAIERRLKNEWLKANPGKDFNSKEGVDFLYGDLNGDPHFTPLAEEEFRNDPKHQKRLERYDGEAKKIYKKKEDDPHWQKTQQRIAEETAARIKLLEKTPANSSKVKLPEKEMELIRNNIVSGVRRKHEDFFRVRYIEKTGAYLFNPKEHEREVLSSYFSTPPPKSGGSTTMPSFGRNRFGGRGVNAINNLMNRFRNPTGKVGTKAANTAIKVVVSGIKKLFTSPWFWSIIGSAIISVVTFLTSLFLGPSD